MPRPSPPLSTRSDPKGADNPMTRTLKNYLVRTSLALGVVLIAAACGSSTSGTASSSTTTTVVQSTTSTSAAAPTTVVTTTTTLPSLPGACPDGLTATQATVIGVQDWVRIRLEPTVASEEIGRFDVGSTVAVLRDTLGYDGSDYWWVTVQVPATGGCGSVAGNFLTDGSGRLDQQIPGLSFQAPTSSGTWAYADRTSFRDPIDGSLDGAFFTHYTVTVADGLLIDERLAGQLKEFEDFDYDYPADWYREVTVPGADRAVRLIPVQSGSGDIVTDRLLVEIGQTTVEAFTDVYIEDLEFAPIDDLGTFLDSVSFDTEIFLQAVSQ